VGDDDGPRRITLVDSLGEEWIKLPLLAMQQVGPAAQTLGGLVKMTTKETYSAVSEIAGSARLPVATVRKHLRTLDAGGWIANAGRQHTRRGAPRRTATIKITAQTIDHLTPFGVLPWWACCNIRKVGRLPWCAKAVLSVVMARLWGLKAAADQQQDNADLEELVGAIENLGGDDRFAFPLRWLESQTGLDHKSVTTAKRLLNHRYGIVRWTGESKPKHDVTLETHILAPNWDFHALFTPTGEGRGYVGFGK
jgi:hypothetical protein